MSRIKARGYSTIAGFCRAFGLPYAEVSALVSMRKPAYAKRTVWRGIAEQIADALSCNIDDLFTERQAAGRVKPVVRQMDEEELVALADLRGTDEVSRLPSPEITAYQSQRAMQLMDCLTPRQRQIIQKRFWHGDTYDQIGKSFGVHGQRIRQIEAQAIRKMQKAASLHAEVVKKPFDWGVTETMQRDATQIVP